MICRSLFNNPLGGTLPTCLGSLVQLRNLFFGNMSLSGTIPASLGSLTSMVLLGLHVNNLVGTVPPSLGNLHNVSLMCVPPAMRCRRRRARTI
jgi:hypothetical protein